MPRSITGVSRAGAVFFALIALTHPASGASPRLVAELNEERWDTHDLPFSLLPAGDDRLVFLTRSQADPTIFLWASDGTTHGTRPLAELGPVDVRGLGTLNNLAFYDGGARPWRTDGTIGGTYPLTRQLPGGLVSVIARSRLYFISCESGYETSRCEVWSTDGTLEGTGRVGTAELAEPREMVALGDDAYFFSTSADGLRAELWRASAAEGRVERLKTLQTPSWLTASGPVAVGGRLFFQAPRTGQQIWTSDGTAAGTVPVTDFALQNSRATQLLGGYLGRAWFVANDGTNGTELWSSDGTAAGTRRATNFGPPRPFPLFEDGTASVQLAQVGDRLLFTAYTHGRLELWTTTGNWRTSQPLRACPGGCPGVLDVPIATTGGRAAFWTDLPSSATEGVTELWLTDGTGPGTTRVRRFEYYPIAGISDISVNGGLFFFSLADSFFRDDRFLWSSDGTAEGTVKLGENPDLFFSDLSPPVAVGGRFFFPAVGEDFPSALWVTGRRGPAVEVLALPPSAVSSRPRPMATAADRLLVFTCTAGRCPELWSTDSTELVHLFENSELERSCESYPVEWSVPAGPRVLFDAYWDCTLTQGFLMLGTDGTSQGSEDIPLPAYWCGEPPVPFHDRAFFTACFQCGKDPCGGLGSSDGTAAGTMPVVTLPPGKTGRLVSDGATLCVPYWEAAGAAQVWCSDGTAAGTAPFGPRLAALSAVALLEHRVFFLSQGSDSTPATLGRVTATGLASLVSLTTLGAEEPLGFTAAAGRLWFAARQAGDPAQSWWLWSSDGTAEGTRRLPAEVRRESLFPFTFDAALQLTTFAGRIYFAGEDDRHGRELWSSDGTVAGTAPLADLAPGPADGAPLSNVVIWRGRLYFAASDPEHGRELWSSDGTAAGTRREFDLFPGPRWSAPDDLRVAGDKLYFAAQDEEHGRELWVLEEGAGGKP